MGSSHYLLHAVALPLVAKRRQAEQVSLLHLSVHLVVGRLVPGGGHQVNRHLRQLTHHLSHVPLRDQPPHHSAGCKSNTRELALKKMKK